MRRVSAHHTILEKCTLILMTVTKNQDREMLTCDVFN